MGRKRVDVGDVVLVPICNGYVPAKVIYASKYFRNVILLGIYGLKIEQKNMPAELPQDFVRLIYTSKQAISTGRWPWMANEPLLPNQQGRSRRIVARDVWIEDQHLGAASSAELATLPVMDVEGAGLVEEWAEEALQKSQ